MTKVFKKRHPSNPVSLSTGKHILFEDMGDGFGFLVVNDPVIIAEFETCIRESRGGLSPSSKTEYDEAVKKKPSSRPLTQNLLRERQTAGLVTIPQVGVVPSVEAVADKPVAPPAPAVISNPSPKVGKRTLS